MIVINLIKKSVIVIFFIFNFSLNFAQEKENNFDFEKMKYGLYFDLNSNFHSSKFSKLENFPFCCPEFKSGFGLGFSLGILSQYNINNDYSLEFRLGLTQISSNFEETENLYLGLDDYPIWGNIKYKIESDIYYLSLAPIINYNIWDRFSIKSGFDLSIILSNSYYQSEDLSDGIFKQNKLPYRNRYNLELNNLNSLIFNWIVGFSYSYQFEADSNLIISPEFLLDIPLNSLHNDVSWYNTQINFGLNATYKFDFEEETIFEHKEIYKIDTLLISSRQFNDTVFKDGVEFIRIDTTFDKNSNMNIISKIIERTDTIYTPKPLKLSVKVNAVGVDDSLEYENFDMIIRQVSYFNMTPLLTYAFFDFNSSKIPERYHLITKEEVKNFSIENLSQLPTLELYRHLFNIIGFRMKKYPDSKITLIGCNTDVGEEKFNLKLSKNRAIAVKDYLTNIWEIPENRIEIKARNLPKNYSFRNTEEGKQENQRVEIYSDKYEIIAPIIINDTIRTTSPTTLRFYIHTKSDTTISNWNLITIQDNDTLKKFIGISTPPNHLDWNIDFEKNTIPQFNTPMYYIAEIIDVLGNKAKSKVGRIDLTQKKIEKSLNVVGSNVVEKFSLILFDFDDISLSQYNEKIKDYINSRLSPKSKVYISGYTDKLGDDNYNLLLSDQRAKELAKSLGISEMNARGFGESVLLYDNSLPEGRFYCRTVQVIVETPVEKNNEN